MQLFLDCDGVLADFDKAASQLLGMWPSDFEKERGTVEFWDKIHSDPNFFLDLEPMPDMWELYNGVKHLDPIILTGIPKYMDPLNNEKIEWSLKMFGEDQRIICCRAKEKCLHGKPEDILIDDRNMFKKFWEKMGGTYVVHTSAKNSLDKLKEMCII